MVSQKIFSPRITSIKPVQVINIIHLFIIIVEKFATFSMKSLYTNMIHSKILILSKLDKYILISNMVTISPILITLDLSQYYHPSLNL